MSDTLRVLDKQLDLVLLFADEHVLPRIDDGVMHWAPSSNSVDVRWVEDSGKGRFEGSCGDRCASRSDMLSVVVLVTGTHVSEMEGVDELGKCHLSSVV